MVAEEGSHAELMEKKGLYYDLVNTNADTSDVQTDTSLSPKVSDDSILDEEPEQKQSKIEEEEITEEDKKKASFMYLMKVNSKEWPYITLGIIGSFIVGASFPVFAVIFGEIYGILSDDNQEEVKRQANIYSIVFLVLGFLVGIGTFLQTYMFTFAGVKLTSRLRILTFKSMMSQEMGWFDDSKNAIGALCARLAGDCAAVQGATGSRLGSIVQAGATIIIGIIVSFFYSWQMTLISSLTIPAVLLGIIMESRLVEKSNVKEKEAIENATRMAVEAISNIRTVASLGQEEHVYERYSKEIDNVHEFCKRKSRLRGLVFGLGQTVPLMGYGLSLGYGGYLVASHSMEYQDVIK